MRHIALEIPLRAFPVVRGWQSRYPAHAGVQALGNALDHTTFARSVATFKQNDDLVAGFDHPVLQLDQFGLHAKEFAKVPPTLLFVALRADVQAGVGQGIEVTVFKFELEFFIVAVSQIVFDALD